MVVPSYENHSLWLMARRERVGNNDVDLLVVLPKADHKRLSGIEILRILNGLPISKDVVVTVSEETQSRGNILRPALQEGKMSYERK